MDSGYNCGCKPDQLLKLHVELGVSSDIFYLSMNYRSNCQQRAMIKDATSQYIPIAVGMPEGALQALCFGWHSSTAIAPH